VIDAVLQPFSSSSLSCAARWWPTLVLALGLCAHGLPAGAAPHEPGGRRHGARGAARRGGGFLLVGLSLPAMSLGGFIAALAVAWLAGWVTRSTPQREDASFAAFYLIALALGCCWCRCAAARST
jgi:hypothetical protein